ncbi:hypothetical protein [Helcobacillus massiliensis]|uniref:hypothetical protein n=1 Tax=Helcobacillus massiliensis TaxID=521392 RepID=UPI0025564895|nr:hypothetical protein [Helcobacillus massiliensis]MDK7742195.1 hypothetical protein [Helcobacillus massiliensis]WOO93746.1 hypothetical protein R3I40_03940 [Helcobacillus massiliensis]
MSGNESTIATGSRWGRVWGIVSVAAVALTLLAVAFVWPSAEGEADGISVAVTGQPEAVEGFVEAAEGGLGEVVDIVVVDDRDAAVAGIKQREFIGALVLGEEPEVLTASANGQVPAAFMTEMASQVQINASEQMYAGVTGQLQEALVSGEGDPVAMLNQLPESLPAVQVTDVVPYSEGDPNGVGLTTAGIPLTVGTLLASILIAFTVAGRWQRISAVLGLGVGGGLLLTLVLGTWLQIYPGPFGLVWAALSLSLTATSTLFVGLHGLLGRAGLGVAAAVTLFAAMPWAAFAVPYQLLPAGLGYIGQWLIPGATTTLTRTVSYFPDASARTSWWALAIWAAGGLILALLARQKRPSETAASPATTVRH